MLLPLLLAVALDLTAGGFVAATIGPFVVAK